MSGNFYNVVEPYEDFPQPITLISNLEAFVDKWGELPYERADYVRQIYEEPTAPHYHIPVVESSVLKPTPLPNVDHTEMLLTQIAANTSKEPVVVKTEAHHKEPELPDPRYTLTVSQIKTNSQGTQARAPPQVPTGTQAREVSLNPGQAKLQKNGWRSEASLMDQISKSSWL